MTPGDICSLVDVLVDGLEGNQQALVSREQALAKSASALAVWPNSW